MGLDSTRSANISTQLYDKVEDYGICFGGLLRGEVVARTAWCLINRLFWVYRPILGIITFFESAVHESVCLSVCLFVSQSVYVCLTVSLCLSLCLSVCLFCLSLSLEKITTNIVKGYVHFFSLFFLTWFEHLYFQYLWIIMCQKCILCIHACP